MSVAASESDGQVDVHVSDAGLSSGWDITYLTANGRPVLPLKKGEFATKEEALAAGFERGHAAIKADNYPGEISR
ncbi:hypothetical protein [Pseudomonas savastanoi]|uniref:Uncharacterized protein n=1 Tax=Pseudomonas savastanoi TaxID=29438 RepID=A0AAW3LZN6_PSESS|nr:hypothetical protein [Pseudomonas savastanoi]KTC59069.1 hypothetical protein AO287_21485 [Pseudomonas savastanoi]